MAECWGIPNWYQRERDMVFTIALGHTEDELAEMAYAAGHGHVIDVMDVLSEDSFDSLNPILEIDAALLDADVDFDVRERVLSKIAARNGVPTGEALFLDPDEFEIRC